MLVQSDLVKYPGMKTTVSLSKAQAQLPRLVRLVERGNTIAISKQDETVAYLVSRDRLEAIVETLEIMGNSAAMRAIRQAKGGKTKYYPLSALDEDEG